MFDTLFRYPAVLRRHLDGPLVTERAAYLAGLAARGQAPGMSAFMRNRVNLDGVPLRS